MTRREIITERGELLDEMPKGLDASAEAGRAQWAVDNPEKLARIRKLGRASIQRTRDLQALLASGSLSSEEAAAAIATRDADNKYQRRESARREDESVTADKIRAVALLAPRNKVPQKGDVTPYKGRKYRVDFAGKTKYGMKVRLSFIDGSKSFWVPLDKLDSTASTVSSKPPRRSRGGYGRDVAGTPAPRAVGAAAATCSEGEGHA